MKIAYLILAATLVFSEAFAGAFFKKNNFEFLNLKETLEHNILIYSKYSILSQEDLANFDQVLIRLLDPETQNSLSTNLQFKKDFFKSVKIAHALIIEILKTNKSSEQIRNLPEYGTLIDTLNALRNNGLSPVEEVVEIFTILSTISDHLRKPEITFDPGNKRLNYPEPLPVKNEEFLRPHLLSQNTAPCLYAGPKKGYGYKAGLKINCSGQELKLKFGAEKNSGPFNSRIMRALGYETPQIDYVPQLEMNYDRRLITEFNSQKPTTVYINFAGKTISKKIGNTRKKNALGYLIEVKLKDNTKLTGAELTTFLNSLYSNITLQFNEELESKIDTVTFGEGSIVKDLDGIEVGPWRFEEPRHFNNSKLRQALILFAWFGNVDFPMNNNRLYLVKDENKKYISVPVYIDVGFGLGITNNVSQLSSSDLDRMSDIMSSPVIENTESSSLDFTKKTNLQLIPKTPNKMLRDLKYQDVINGVSLLCSLTESQIIKALKDSGYDEAHAQTGAQKLIHRRTQLIYDFDLNQKFSECL